VDNDTVSREGG